MGLLRQAAQRVHTALGALLNTEDASSSVVDDNPWTGSAQPLDELGQLVGMSSAGELNASQLGDLLVAHPPANADEVATALSQIQREWTAKGGNSLEAPLEKAIGPEAADRARSSDDPSGSARGYAADPRYALTGFGYVERPGPLSFDMLRALTYRVSLLADIIQTRVGQMSNFCTPQITKFEPGFRLTTRDRLKPPTSADKREIVRLTQYVLNAGRANNSYIRPGHEALTRAVLRDSFTFDQMAIEMVLGRDGKPSYWIPRDAGSMRLHRSWVMDPRPTTTKAVQVIDMRPVAEWGPSEMILEMINNRTDLRSYGYGFPEAEMVFTTITHFLWGINHNALFFKQGTTQPGILNLKGKLPKKELRAFRRFWYTLVSGNANAWRSPIVNAEEGLEFISLMKSNTDMEWSSWLDFLIKVIAAAFQMDPIEINFKFGNSGGGAKCYAPETELLAFDGSIRRAESFVLGDQLMGPDSTPRTIRKMTSGFAEMYEIQPTKKRGESWRCNGQHQLSLINIRTGEVEDIEVEDFLKKPATVQEFYRLFMPLTGVDFTPREAPALDPYFFGLWVGDGSKSRSQGVVITKPDLEIVACLADVARQWELNLTPCAKFGHRIGGRRGGAVRVNRLRETLDSLWTDGSIHPSIKFGSRDIRLQFLAGFIDTDGHARPVSFTFSQKNKKTADDVAFIARSLGFRVVLRSFVVNKTTYVRSEDVARVGGTVYYRGSITGPVEQIPTRLPRKQFKSVPWQRGESHDPRLTGFTIKSLGRGVFVGWETDGDHRHLLGDFTVSHNSMFGAADKAKTVESKEKGLRPRLNNWARIINENFVWPYNDDFVFEHVGLMSMTPKEYADLMTQRVRSVFMVNEARAELDLPPAPDGDVILDANYLAHIREIEATKVQQQQFQQQHDLKTQQLQQTGQQQQAQLALQHHQVTNDAAQATQAALARPGALPPKEPRPSDKPTPPAPPSPDVGTLPNDPKDAQQIAELEALLQPKEGKKV